ncbi:MAG: hypothetical protein JWN52_7204 [Actinomycetia bacterium]|nr:hypothetical protein [Actinomycetes bacterium]
MTTYPTWAAGQRVTAALLAGMQINRVEASGGTSNATTTLADCPGMNFIADANATYDMRLVASYDSPTATDIKFAWTGPSGAGMVRSITAPAAGMTTNADTTVTAIRRSMGTQQVGGGMGTGNFLTWLEQITLTTTTSGVVQLQFAANAAGTAVFNSGGYFIYVRVA